MSQGRKVALGCVTLVGLFMAIVVIIALAVSGGSKTNSNNVLPLRAGSAVVPSGVTVHVGGGTTEGFSGSIGNGRSQRSVQGVSPMTFSIDSGGFTAIAVVQAKGRYSAGYPLVVSLTGCPDGQVHTQSTSADYGVVTVSC